MLSERVGSWLRIRAPSRPKWPSRASEQCRRARGNAQSRPAESVKFRINRSEPIRSEPTRSHRPPAGVWRLAAADEIWRPQIMQSFSPHQSSAELDNGEANFNHLLRSLSAAKLALASHFHLSCFLPSPAPLFHLLSLFRPPPAQPIRRWRRLRRPHQLSISIKVG